MGKIEFCYGPPRPDECSNFFRWNEKNLRLNRKDLDRMSIKFTRAKDMLRLDFRTLFWINLRGNTEHDGPSMFLDPRITRAFPIRCISVFRSKTERRTPAGSGWQHFYSWARYLIWVKALHRLSLSLGHSPKAHAGAYFDVTRVGVINVVTSSFPRVELFGWDRAV